jgi:hypothetical protein
MVRQIFRKPPPSPFTDDGHNVREVLEVQQLLYRPQEQDALRIFRLQEGSMIAILVGIFVLIIVGASATFVYIVFSESRTDSVNSKVTLRASPRSFGTARRSTRVT